MNRRNLLPPHRITAKRRRRATRRWVAIDATYLALLVIGGAAYAWSVTGPSEADGRHNTVADVARLNKSLTHLKQQAATLDAQLKSAQEITDRPDWSVLLAVLAGTLGDDVVLNAVDCSTAANAGSDALPQTCRLGGVGRTQGAVTQFAVRIEQLSLFARVRLTQTAPQTFYGGQGIGFTIVCDFPEGAR